ncbi:hypothetical protein D3C81_1234070 [compost metagenome]
MVELQAKVHTAAFFTVGHLTFECSEARQLSDHAGAKRFFDQRVGPPRVDAGQPPLGRLTDFPGARQLALGVVGATEPDLPALAHAIEHGAGVRAVDGQLLPIGQFDVRQEPLVAAQEPPLLEWRKEHHQPCQLRKPRAMRWTASSSRGRLWV